MSDIENIAPHINGINRSTNDKSEPNSPCVGVSAINVDSTFASPTPSTGKTVTRRTPGAEKYSLRRALENLGLNNSDTFFLHEQYTFDRYSHGYSYSNGCYSNNNYFQKPTFVNDYSLWGKSERKKEVNQNPNYCDDSYLEDDNFSVSYVNRGVKYPASLKNVKPFYPSQQYQPPIERVVENDRYQPPTVSAPKNDLNESPNSKLKFKTFYKTFKAKEKEGFEVAKKYAIEFLPLISEKSHWRIFLEMADLAKRENNIKDARHYYQIVNRIQPLASQGWLEYAKMEEECGDLQECQNILIKGQEHCPYNESLMVKSLKHYERMDMIKEARTLLGKLKGVSVDKTWRTLMEGALMEARQGNVLIARNVFRYLIQTVPWYGPIYLEACKFEEKCEELVNAMNFVEKGLQENPRYGPLWFCAIRLHEKLSKGNLEVVLADLIEKATKSISKELVWKLYFEAAQIMERDGNIQVAREHYVKAVEFCPENLLWKVWVGGSKTELYQGNVTVARNILKRALSEVPPKMKSSALLEFSRLEEYANRIPKAREILDQAKQCAKHEWKVFLESVLLEIRANNMPGAIFEAKEALKIHTGTGRLWAILIQLRQNESQEKQVRVFRRALSEVPKSGEVWCEGARIAIRIGDYAAARQYINFAIQFTPQYGDSFIEYLRLELLENRNNPNFAVVEQACVNADPNYGALWLYCKNNPMDSSKQVLREAYKYLTQQNSNGRIPILDNLNVNTIYTDIHNRSEEERRKVIFV